MSLLNNTSRGILEQIIDTCITAIPTWMPDYRKDEVKKMWMYDRAEDFVLGLAVGMIYAYFEGTFLTIYHRQIDPQERAEVMSVITLRMPQIREALFSTGRLQCLIVIFLNIVLRNMTTRIRVE